MNEYNFWDDKINKIVSEKGFLNIAHECLDSHLPERRKQIAIRYIPSDWNLNKPEIKEITFEDLFFFSCKFANALKHLEFKKTDVLFSLSPRGPELYVVMLGTLRMGMIFSPLFSAFGPEPILKRMKMGKGKIIFSLASLFRKKVLPILNQLPDLKKIILIDDDGSLKDIQGAIDFHDLMKNSSQDFFLEKTLPDDVALLHFTSGTTGEPKGAVHVHKAVVYHSESGKEALDLKPSDLFWCTADPGWVTGTSYGIISPLTLGATLLIDGGEFNPLRWYQILSHFKINVWYTSPTALRMLMRAGEELPRQFDFLHVRFASCVGEALNSEVVKWVKLNLGILIHDNWWQTETGGIIICNDSQLAVRPGSMGKPLQNIEVQLISEYNGDKIIFSKVGEKGEIAIKKGWPSMFVSYLDREDRYKKCFTGDWYLSGDLARQDEDGYFWFIGRKDDVIKTSGHLVGPFEIENVLMEHLSVLEAAVIGIPDPMIGEVILGFVVLHKGVSPSHELLLDILSFTRKKLGPAISPREIRFVQHLPKTRSGKVLRRLLKARELGLPEGDTSTLEVDHD